MGIWDMDMERRVRVSNLFLYYLLYIYMYIDNSYIFYIKFT